MKRTLTLAALSLIVTSAAIPASVYGQDPGFEQRDTYTTDPITCFGISGGRITLVDEGCVQDEKMNEHDRQQTRSIDRWVRGGVLTLASIMNQVRRLGGMDDMTGGVLDHFKRLSSGFTDKRAPVTAYRVVDVTMSDQERVAYLFEGTGQRAMDAGNRYFIVEAEMQRGLQDATDLGSIATQLSDNSEALLRRMAQSTDSTGKPLAEIAGVQSIGAGVAQDAGLRELGCPANSSTDDATSTVIIDGCPVPIYADDPYGNDNPGAYLALGKAQAADLVSGIQKAAGDPNTCPDSGFDNPVADPVSFYERIVVEARGAVTGAAAATQEAMISQAQLMARRTAELAQAALRIFRARVFAFTVI